MTNDDEGVRPSLAWLRWSAFPALLLLTTGAALALLRLGAPDTLVLLAPALALAGALAALERVIPYERGWLRARGDVPTDLAHVVATVALAPLVQAATLALLPDISGGSGLLAPVPLVIALPLVLLLGDLAPYWFHRASHEWSPFLFRVHAVHHAPTRLYWLNAFRVHPINLAANTALRLAPAVLLGAPHEVLVLASVVSAFANVFAHANVDVRLGALDWIFSGPALHRVHHHVDATTSQSNYGATTIVWDVLFGTRRAPARVRDGEVGVGDATPPEGWLAQLLHPFGLTCCART